MPRFCGRSRATADGESVTVLLDQNVSYRLREGLLEFFSEVVHVEHLQLATSPDIEVWRLARERQWVILTKDGDFADLALLYGYPPKVIRPKIGNTPWRTPLRVLERNADSLRAFLGDSDSSLLLLTL